MLPEMRSYNWSQRIGTVVLYICLGAALIRIWTTYGGGSKSAELNSIAELNLIAVGLCLLLFACVRCFFNLRFAHGMGLAAAALAVPYFWITEQTLRIAGANSWVEFNLPDSFLRFDHQAEWRIPAIGVLVFTFVYCLMKLVSPNPKGHWRAPSVMAGVVTASALLASYLISVRPYRIPMIVDAIYPDYAILHVQKDGLRFEETYVSVWRDGRVGISHSQRRLFQYRFPVASSFPMMLTPTDHEFMSAQALRQHLRDAPGSAPEQLWRWHDEGWYYISDGSRPKGFVKSTGALPPPELIDVFRRLDALPLQNTEVSDTKDICFGFCYDPLAGLGIVFVNQRCRDGSCR